MLVDARHHPAFNTSRGEGASPWGWAALGVLGTEDAGEAQWSPDWPGASCALLRDPSGWHMELKNHPPLPPFFFF